MNSNSCRPETAHKIQPVVFTCQPDTSFTCNAEETVCGYMQSRQSRQEFLYCYLTLMFITSIKPLSRSVQENGARWHSLMVLVFSSQIMVCSHNIAYTPFYQYNLPENTEHDISKSLPVCLFCV